MSVQVVALDAVTDILSFLFSLFLCIDSLTKAIEGIKFYLIVPGYSSLWQGRDQKLGVTLHMLSKKANSGYMLACAESMLRT